MKNIVEVKFQIIDRGVFYPEKSMQILVSRNASVFDELKGHLNEDRHAMDLSKKFLVKIIEEKHVGWH